jgi:hypothetical protein
VGHEKWKEREVGTVDWRDECRICQCGDWLNEIEARRRGWCRSTAAAMAENRG